MIDYKSLTQWVDVSNQRGRRLLVRRDTVRTRSFLWGVTVFKPLVFPDGLVFRERLVGVTDGSTVSMCVFDDSAERLVGVFGGSTVSAVSMCEVDDFAERLVPVFGCSKVSSDWSFGVVVFGRVNVLQSPGWFGSRNMHFPCGGGTHMVSLFGTVSVVHPQIVEISSPYFRFQYPKRAAFLRSVHNALLLERRSDSYIVLYLSFGVWGESIFADKELMSLSRSEEGLEFHCDDHDSDVSKNNGNPTVMCVQWYT